MAENNEKQSSLLVCRVGCPDPQKAQESGFSSLLAAFAGAAGRLVCRVGRHRWFYPHQGGRICPRCMRRQTLEFIAGNRLKWRDY